jgi:hypothetical protein
MVAFQRWVGSGIRGYHGLPTRLDRCYAVVVAGRQVALQVRWKST